MPTFLLLTTLSPQGMQTLRATPERLLEVNREVEALGGRVMRQWAVLGDHDFVSVVQAPSRAVILKVVSAIAARGSAATETLTVLTIDDLVEGLTAD